MSKIFEINWTRARNFEVCIFSENETLSEPMEMLFAALMHPTESADLLDHVVNAIPSSWCVTEDHQRRKSGWSIERTFELFAADAEARIASILTYRDSHGGIAIELIADKSIEGDLGLALADYFAAQEASAGISQGEFETVH